MPLCLLLDCSQALLKHPSLLRSCDPSHHSELLQLTYSSLAFPVLVIRAQQAGFDPKLMPQACAPGLQLFFGLPLSTVPNVKRTKRLCEPEKNSNRTKGESEAPGAP